MKRFILLKLTSEVEKYETITEICEVIGCTEEYLYSTINTECLNYNDEYYKIIDTLKLLDCIFEI